MKRDLLMHFSVDRGKKQINVTREFASSLPKVWQAWTQSEYLDQWWAPRPWKARTKTMDFREGGHWLYAMVGPEGEEHWAIVEFSSIVPLKTYSARDAFCDKNGAVNTSLPTSLWVNAFTEVSDSLTSVQVRLTYDKLSDLETIIRMGFQEGFTAALENLDSVLTTKNREK